MGMAWIILDELPSGKCLHNELERSSIFNGITMENHNFYIGK